jgi:hypothetical protein
MDGEERCWVKLEMLESQYIVNPIVSGSGQTVESYSQQHDLVNQSVLRMPVRMHSHGTRSFVVSIPWTSLPATCFLSRDCTLQAALPWQTPLS